MPRLQIIVCTLVMLGMIALGGILNDHMAAQTSKAASRSRSDVIHSTDHSYSIQETSPYRDIGVWRSMPYEPREYVKIVQLPIP
ncbi:hypothetical protein [Paenibacillus sp. 2TAB19]|uniref:hypothetical protein n=1 Tax=Paenibacillus sp. 2TAB19 TaxID=3233003 RepID=UPI003F9E0C49